MKEGHAAQDLSLSVLIAATDDAPELRELHSLLEPQLAAIGGELLIADGCHDPIMSVPVVLRRPGSDVFELRVELLKMARGSVRAITEDHVRPLPDYCRAIVDCHQANPSALVVAGPIENGSTTTRADWANYFCTFAPFMAPLSQHTQRAPPPVNVSVKRRVVEGRVLGRGEFEFELVPELKDLGETFYTGAVVVEHVQSGSLAHHVCSHFNNGRTTGGLSRKGLSSRSVRAFVLQIIRAPLMPLRLFGQVYREIWSRPQRRRSGIRAAPAVFVLQCAHVCGEFIGYLFGPGKSPIRVH
jgi:hypothetical protein